MIIPSARRRPWVAGALPAAIASVAGLSTIWAIGVAWHYRRLGLTLSHYDARGHLVVARRIVDSITPGWQQIGAVWLPLPHLLNALPVQVDFFYRTGASAVAISIASFVVAAGAITWIVAMITDSELTAAAAASVFALNPNVLYLQSTPMTEPLLIALTTLGVALLIAWVGGSDGLGWPAGVTLALACLTRYEAWPVTACALALAGCARWRNGETWAGAARATSAVALYPAAAILGFAIFSRVVIGEWLVTSGFFVPENKARGDLILAVKEIAWGARLLSSAPLMWIGGAGVGLLLILELAAKRRRPAAVIAVSLLATAVLPLGAFYRGHPFRIRYMVPLIAMQAIGAGAAAGLFRRIRLPAALAVAAVTAATLHPLDPSAPMVVEAQWDRPNVPVRERVTACLGRLRPGEKIMASMGSLGHYMQETSSVGLTLRDFLHEGNGDIWLAAIDRPRPFAGWLLIEEKAEGGDVLAHLARERPHFLDGYSRVCEGAGLALYRRDEH